MWLSIASRACLISERKNLRLKSSTLRWSSPHVTTSFVNPSAPQLRLELTKMSIQKIAASVTRQTNAVVVSAGLMEKTVKVRVGVQKWNKHIGKVYTSFSFPDPAQILNPRNMNTKVQCSQYRTALQPIPYTPGPRPALLSPYRRRNLHLSWLARRETSTTRRELYPGAIWRAG
jgi:hypothetical protein